MPESRRCYAGHFCLSDWPSPSTIKPNPKRNGPIHTECKTIHNVVSSASEDETCGTFNNGKTTMEMQPDLIALDHKQPGTPLKTDNSTTEGFVNLGMNPKPSKTWDMKWHWLRYKEVIEQLGLYWYIGKNNDANYFTKYHPPIHHRQKQTQYIYTSDLLETIPHTIRLFKGVLNRFPVTQYCVYYLKTIRA